MAIDDRTEHLSLPLPHPDNQLSEDVGRLRTSLSDLDGAVNQLSEEKLAKNAAAADAEKFDGKDPADYVLTDDLNSAVRATALTGVNFDTAEPITATDSLIAALGKLQALSSARVELGSIVDGLTSELTDAPLSANQGRVLKGLIDNINAVLQSDDGTLDELQEVVDFIKANREDLDALSISNIAGLQGALDSKADGNDSRITGAAQKSANLSDLTSISDARDNLELGDIARASMFSLSSFLDGGFNSGARYYLFAINMPSGPTEFIRRVTITVNAWGHENNNYITSAVGVIPTEYRPATPQAILFSHDANGFGASGLATVTTSGRIQLEYTAADGSPKSITGLPAGFSITYIVNESAE